MAKYDPLREFLIGLDANTNEIRLSMTQMERVIDTDLPPSARSGKTFWTTGDVKRFPQARAIQDAGFAVKEVDLEREEVIFERTKPAVSPQKTETGTDSLRSQTEGRKTAIVLSETHWDRAWYLPFQEYRVRLVRLIDRMIELLDSTPEFHSFMLDGQMSPIEDYLAIRPEKKADLIRLVKAGRVFVGPWFVLSDEYLVSPESLIRNLMLGLRMAAEYGETMTEGYTPDSFGHIGQLPQILNGFGIESCLFWRGFGPEADELGNEFWWEAGGESRVLTVNIRDGYHNVANAGYPNRGSDRSAMKLDMKMATDMMRSAVDFLAPTANVPYFLLFDGVDHAEANADIVDIIAQANGLYDDVEYVHGTLPDYIAKVRSAIGDLKSWRGEFNRGYTTHVLQSVYSTRIYLKQQNNEAQVLLEAHAEPVMGLAWALGEGHESALLWEAWKLLLRNHPHDDICGCSCDEVHQEDVQRFSEVRQIGRTLTRDAFRGLMAHIRRDEQEGTPFVIFNPSGVARSETAVLTLNFDQNSDDRYFELVDEAGEPIAFTRLGETDFFEAELRKNHYQRRVAVAIDLDLPAVGYRVIYARPLEDLRDTWGVKSGSLRNTKHAPPTLENEFLRAEIQMDGTLSVWDKVTDQRFEKVGYFEDVEDAGDEYDYAPCPNSERFTTVGNYAEVVELHRGPLWTAYRIEQTFLVPESLAEDRQSRSRRMVGLKIVTEVSLGWRNRRLEFKTTVENVAKDHRLRVCFPTGIKTDVASADGHYDVVTREIDQDAGEGWVQPPVPTKHQRTFVDVSDETNGLAVFNKGLPEYEIMRQGGNTVAVTLLRCVDMLFRDDLLTRPGYAWLPLYTPDAQCLGTHTFEYAFAPHAGDWRVIYDDAHCFNTPLIVRRGDEREGFVPFESVPKDKKEFALFETTELVGFDMGGELGGGHSFVKIGSADLKLTALKRSEDGTMLVVRVVNLGDEDVPVEVDVAFDYSEVKRLAMSEAVVGDGRNVVAKPREVVTLGFVVERGKAKAPLTVG